MAKVRVKGKNILLCHVIRKHYIGSEEAVEFETRLRPEVRPLVRTVRDVRFDADEILRKYAILFKYTKSEDGKSTSIIKSIYETLLTKNMPKLLSDKGKCYRHVERVLYGFTLYSFRAPKGGA